MTITKGCWHHAAAAGLSSELDTVDSRCRRISKGQLDNTTVTGQIGECPVHHRVPAYSSPSAAVPRRRCRLHQTMPTVVTLNTAIPIHRTAVFLDAQTRKPPLEVAPTTAEIFAWLLLGYSFQLRSAFQPRSAILAVIQLL